MTSGQNYNCIFSGEPKSASIVVDTEEPIYENSEIMFTTTSINSQQDGGFAGGVMGGDASGYSQDLMDMISYQENSDGEEESSDVELIEEG